jgi:hypothetical protein
VAWPTGSYGGSVTSGGATQATSAQITEAGPYVGLSPGFWMTFELPF